MTKNFHSSFIVDVQIGADGIVLTDSQRTRFYVSVTDQTAMSTFKSWLSNVFMKGAPQRPTVIEYSTSGDAGSVELNVVRICTTQEKTEQ